MIPLKLLPLLLICAATPAAAMQSLIPAPYPNTAPGAMPLDPKTTEPNAPQEIMRDPYPQVMGEASQGNPPIAKRHRHQRLVPSSSQRKYRVDRP